MHTLCIYFAYSMHIFCIYHAYTMHIPCIYYAYTMHILCIYCILLILCIYFAYTMHTILYMRYYAYTCIYYAYTCIYMHILCLYYAYTCICIRCIYDMCISYYILFDVFRSSLGRTQMSQAQKRACPFCPIKKSKVIPAWHSRINVT